jgi:hypothetical protein
MAERGRIGVGLAYYGGETEIVLVDHDPLTTPTDAERGALIINVITGAHYRKLDDGSTVNVTQSAPVTSQNMEPLANGSVIETIDIEVLNVGGTVKLRLQKQGGGDLTVQLEQGNLSFDATPVSPNGEVDLNAGSDTAPTLNYVYLEDDGSGVTTQLVATTGGWPLTAHAPVATVLVQSPASVGAPPTGDGAYKVHAWTDHMANAVTGHLAHINKRLRAQQAEWITGVSPTLTIVGASTPDDVFVDVTTGQVFQLHEHSFPARDMGSGDPVFVVNQNGTPFDRVTNLNTLLTDSAGVTMSGRYFSLVLWGVVNEKDADCKLMINLPSGSYNNQTDLENDTDGYSDFSIPSEFRGTGFLIATLQLRHQVVGGGTWTDIGLVDLRGLFPSTSAGGGPAGGGGAVEFADNQFRVFNVTDITRKMAVYAGGISPATTRTATMPDEDVTFGYDANAIHDDEAGEISAITEKAAPVDADNILAEDSAAANAKKRVELGKINRSRWLPHNTPANITANQNDYDPGDALVYRLNPTGTTREITGFAPTGGNSLNGHGRHIVIWNIGSVDLKLMHQNAGSTAANRILVSGGGDMTLASNERAALWYDPTTARWRTSTGGSGA